MKKRWLTLIGFILGFSLLGAAYVMYGSKAKVRTLPYIKPLQANLGDLHDAQGRHIVADFSLTDQTGKTITRADFKDAVTVVDFFFTRCQGICPKLTSQLQRVYDRFKGNPEVKLISHTVQPEYDSVPILAAYARHYHADAGQWHFVTGNKKELYNLARLSYLISDTKGSGGADDFVHTQNIALVDKTGHVRGIYDGTDSTDVNRLMTEVNMLIDDNGN